MEKQIAYCLLILLALTGCGSTRSFNRVLLRQELASTTPIVTESEIQEVLNRKAQLSRPFVLALYFSKLKSFNPPTFQPAYRTVPSIHWSADDKEQIKESLKDKMGGEIVSKIIILGDSLVHGDTVKHVRLGAAAAGTDAVLTIGGVSDLLVRPNRWALTYPLLVTSLFVPGNEVEGLFLAYGNMYDVRNGYLYASVESEETARNNTIPFNITNKARQVLTEAKSGAVSLLGERMGIEMVRIH